MPSPKPILAILAAAVLAAGVTACGDEEPKPSIPLENAQTLVGALQQIQNDVNDGNCTTARANVQDLQSQIEELPSTVDDKVSDALQEGALNLSGLVEDECEAPEETTTEETTTDEETTTEETTTDETTPTEPTTTTEPTTPTTGGGGGVGPPGGGNGGL